MISIGGVKKFSSNVIKLIKEYKDFIGFLLSTFIILANYMVNPYGGVSLLPLLVIYVILSLIFVPIISINVFPNSVKSILTIIGVLIFSTVCFYLFIAKLNELNLASYNIYLTKDLAYWYFSSFLQSFAALLGIIGAFVVFIWSLRNQLDIKLYRDKIKLLIPSIFYISIILIISVIFLPLSEIFAVNKIFFTTTIFIMTMFAILSISSLCYAIFKMLMEPLEVKKTENTVSPRPLVHKSK